MLRRRVLKRDEHRMLRLACIHGLQFASPPGEQAQAFLRIANLVGQIVRPAAERVDVVKILVQPFRQKKTDDVKILVVIGRQPARLTTADRRQMLRERGTL
jgi:glycerol-3-phosphate O-acyltransferase